MKKISVGIALAVVAVLAFIAGSIYSAGETKKAPPSAKVSKSPTIETPKPSIVDAPKKTSANINPPPTAQDWADIAKLPDWSGVWNPKITDQDAQVKSNPPPWNEQAASKIQHMFAEDKAGRPQLIFPNCLPEAHPSWMLITHNAMEVLFTRAE
jgi:hypothetical protein